MSQEDVKAIHRGFDAFNRRDLEGFLELMDEDVEGKSRLAAMEGAYRGHAGMRRWWADLLEIVPDYTTEVLEVREHGDWTVAIVLTRGHGVASDAPIAQRTWMPMRWRDGKCVWWAVFLTEEEALEAAESADARAKGS